MAHVADDNRSVLSDEAAKIEMWKTVLENPRVPLLKASPDIPSPYILVIKAGSGLDATAYFCLPKNAVSAAAQCDKADGTSHAPKKLASTLQVVKVFSVSDQLAARSELTILKEIQQHRQAHMEELPLVELIAWDSTNSIPHWIAMSTLPICSTLASLVISIDHMPEEFIWLVYLRVSRALDFLHKTCDIAHGDLHPGNVIIGYPRVDNSDLPQVKLIDFGRSQRAPFKKNPFNLDLFDKDTQGFIYVMNTIVHSSSFECISCDSNSKLQAPHDCCNSKFCIFHKAICDEDGSYSESGSILADLWEEYELYAKNKIESCLEATRVQIRDLIASATHAQSQNIETKIQEIWLKAKTETGTSCSV